MTTTLVRPGQRLILPPWVRSSSRRVQIAGSSFSPTDVAGLAAWYDFSDLSTLWQDAAGSTAVASDGDPIGRVADKSGAANHAVQATTAAKPTYKTGIQNSLSSCRTDGGDYLEASVSAVSSTVMTVFVVCQKISLPETTAAILSTYISGGDDYDSSGEAVIGYHGAGTTALLDYRNASLSSQSQPSNGTTYIYSSKYDSANNTTYLNGSVGTPVGSTGTFNWDRILFGCRSQSGYSRFNNYEYFEILIYLASLSDTDRGNVESYLNSKWAVY